MNDEFEGREELKDLFETILGSSITLKDTIVANEETLFCLLVNKLDKSHHDDEAIFELTGIDLTQSKNELWFVVEALLKITYGHESFSMIMWYILDRFSEDKKLLPYEDGEGKEFSLVTVKDLYFFIKHRFPN
tara:strand:+ start:92 stop:490 length:399 start_codon:yes stop_codon:yes gene_type:complete